MIQYLKVKGLNKRLDGEFEFNEDLNIFTGSNGSGKTTLLKLIWYLISGNLNQILAQIPFSFHFNSNGSVRFEHGTGLNPTQVIFDYRFGEEEGVYEFIVIDAETGKD